MAREMMRMTRIGDPETDEVMRKLRKDVVGSLMAGGSGVKASKWFQEREAAVKAER